jgi:hypothetical protein
MAGLSKAALSLSPEKEIPQNQKFIKWIRGRLDSGTFPEGATMDELVHLAGVVLVRGRALTVVKRGFPELHMYIKSGSGNAAKFFSSEELRDAAIPKPLDVNMLALWPVELQALAGPRKVIGYGLSGA